MGGEDSLSLIRRIAVGGTAEIWLARHPTLGNVVSKRVLTGGGPELVKRLVREREALSRVRSENVIRLLEAGEDHLILEHVDGLDLAALVAHLKRRGESLPLGAAMALIEGIARGLEAMHSLGLVHADLSPANVMIGRDGSVRIIDLGLARRPDEPPPREVEGTLAYQAPEQLRLESIDARADLYALGLIAYEIVTSVPARPTGMLGAIELLEARMKQPAPPSQVRSSVPPALDRAILRLLDPDPRGRPASAKQWLSEVPHARQAKGAASEASPEGRNALRAVMRKVGGPMIPAAATEAQPTKKSAPEPIDDTLLLPQSRPRRFPMIAGVMAALGALAIWFVSTGEVPPVPPPVPPPPRAEPPPTPFELVPHASPRVETPTITELESLAVEKPMERRRRKPKPLLRIAISGSVEIQGGGMGGPAPKTSDPLKEGATLLQLVSGEIRLLVRVERRRESIRVTIGAPPGSYYEVDCAGHPKGSTPLIGIPLGDEMRCSATRADGVRAMFAIARVVL